MKILLSLTITILVAAPLLAQTQTPDSTAAEAQARQELNEAARAYREGNFAAAQAHSERALLLDPQNKTAPFFVARTIHAQYKPGDVTPENVAKAREAIAAYHRILERSPGDDEAYKAVAYLYGALKEHQLLHEWIRQRATDVSMSNEKRAEAYVVLASKDWECSYRITELPGNKITNINTITNKASVTYKMPEKRAQFELAQECANRGLELANTAISLAPENESAWSYKTNILLELAKLAEMLGQVESKREFLRQYEEARNETTKVSNRRQSNP